MFTTLEAVTAEINYRHELAETAALASQVRRPRRRWLSRVTRSTPASRAFSPVELRFRAHQDPVG
jgi:hypothetical protein